MGEGADRGWGRGKSKRRDQRGKQGVEEGA